MDSIVQCFIFLCLTTASFSTETANQDQENITYYFVGYRHTKPLELQCKIKESTASNMVIKWYKDDKEIDLNDLENKKHYETKIVDEESVLVIIHPTEKDLGNYTCQLQSSSSNSSLNDHHIQVLSELVVRMEPSATVIEGEELKLKCVVISKSPPHKISWRFGNETYESSKGRVELKADDKNIPNAIFTMKDAVMADRGEYTCLAYATRDDNPKEFETYVRVKDKLAALWPFLGICAEVFVLCAIILIYEKKRNQAELEESDTDQSPDQKNTPDLGKDTVRQRK